MRTADGPGRTGPRPAADDPARLRRRAGRWEDVVSVLLGLLAAGGLALGWVAGGAAQETVQQRAAVESAERVPVQATVVDRMVAVTEMQSGQQTATVRYPTPDGGEQTGGTTLTGLYEPGDRVQVWTDRSGELVPPPSTAEDAVVVAVASGLMAVVGCGIVVLLLGRLGYHWTGRRIARAWELGWAEVEPQWSGRRRA